MKLTPLSSLVRHSFGLITAGLLLLAGCSKSNDTPSVSSADSSAAPGGKTITVGFAQTGAESKWRVANTESLKSEAAKRGITLKFVDAQSKPENQITAVRNFVTQKVDAIVIAPIVSTGWEPVLKEAKDANIPVLVEDRSIDADPSLYKCFIGSDFIKEGHLAAEWLVKKTGGKGRILELSGEPGSAAAEDRKKAFADGIAATPGLQIIDSQSGYFKRDQGKQVMEALLKKHGKDWDILYAHNDDMALGAIQAIQEAGLKPGQDVLVVSIDGEQEAVQAIVDGKINVVVECNPGVGPVVFDALAKILAGQPVPAKTFNMDHVFDSTNAAAEVKNRAY
jgi:simple sugar transport system substrate-binding protein